MPAETTSGRLVALYRYPVKGLSPEPLSTVEVKPGETLPHDRRYAIDGAMCVCRTDDGGQTWQQFRAGLPQNHAYHLVYRHGLALAPATGSERVLAMASTTGGVWISEDAGETWSTLDASLPPVAAVAWA